jgi:hypothetical protein
MSRAMSIWYSVPSACLAGQPTLDAETIVLVPDQNITADNVCKCVFILGSRVRDIHVTIDPPITPEIFHKLLERVAAAIREIRSPQRQMIRLFIPSTCAELVPYVCSDIITSYDYRHP